MSSIPNISADEVRTIFLGHLSGERRLAANTVDAYGRDIGDFQSFLVRHLGEPAGLRALAGLRAADFRAYLAFRREGGLGSASVQRLLSALRTLYRYIERRWDVANSEIALIRGPRAKRPVPKALSVEGAAAMLSGTIRNHGAWRSKPIRAGRNRAGSGRAAPPCCRWPTGRGFASAKCWG